LFKAAHQVTLPNQEKIDEEVGGFSQGTVLTTAAVS
jgi:hypothetical protein